MSKENNLGDFFTDIAAAIRKRKNYPDSTKICANDFPTEIASAKPLKPVKQTSPSFNKFTNKFSSYSGTGDNTSPSQALITGDCFWSDGRYLYFSFCLVQSSVSSNLQYILDRSSDKSAKNGKLFKGYKVDEYFRPTTIEVTFYARNIGTDGNNIYLSNTEQGYGTIGNYQLLTNNSSYSDGFGRVAEKTGKGADDIALADRVIESGTYIGTDGTTIYYSHGTKQFFLRDDKETGAKKTWGGTNQNVSGSDIGTDGENIYQASWTSHYVLDKATSTWSEKTWNGLTDFAGSYVGTDGSNTYYSYSSNQYVLDKSTSTWYAKTWSGLNQPDGDKIWVDGDNIYYSGGSDQYQLNKETRVGPHPISGLL